MTLMVVLCLESKREDTGMTVMQSNMLTDHGTRDTNIHTQPFYGSMDIVWDNPGEPVAEETFTYYYYIHLLRSIASSLFMTYVSSS